MLPRPGSARTEEIIDALTPPPEYVAPIRKPYPRGMLPQQAQQLPDQQEELSEADRLFRLPPEHTARRLSGPAGIACHDGCIFVVVSASPYEWTYVSDIARRPPASARVLRLREHDGALLTASPLLKVARPKGLAVADNKVFVADGAGGEDCIAVLDATTLQPENSFGPGHGQLSGVEELAYPCGLTVHGFELIVCDRGAHRLRVLSFSGEAVRDIGSEGRRPGEFKEPTSCIVAHGRLFTAEAAGARLQVLTMAGEPLQVLPMPTANRVPPCLHGLCLGDRERQLWATDTDRNVLYRLSNPNTNQPYPRNLNPRRVPPPPPTPAPAPSLTLTLSPPTRNPNRRTIEIYAFSPRCSTASPSACTPSESTQHQPVINGTQH